MAFRLLAVLYYVESTMPRKGVGAGGDKHLLDSKAKNRDRTFSGKGFSQKSYNAGVKAVPKQEIKDIGEKLLE